ncbi:MAG TPA: glucose-6-phosphate isomerase [Gemmatimonadaceae bacterium]|nr:glucose-6-phosphate isomerase [Gemmatimonadaceae bacterium]
MAIGLDYTNMMGEVVAGGVSAHDWAAAPQAFRRAHEGLLRRRNAGELGFLDLPTDAALHRQSADFAKAARGKFDDVVVLGIGGSALGPIALRTALLAPGWNSLTTEERRGNPRLHVLDNVDPRTIAALLDRLALERSLFIVISKSGGTAETMAQYLVVRDRLDKHTKSAGDHLVFVTDPKKGALREIARAENIPALDIPPAVGGRYSVLTPVGVLPAALVGIDTGELLEGANDIASRCAGGELRDNPAGLFGTLEYLADTTLGRHIHVLMPYSDPLRDLADWFVQLWAESLGKHREPGDKGAGPTPLGALGATDQHSKVQLFMEGPPDKTVAFIAVREVPADVAIPRLHSDVKELGYLGGHHLGELLAIEQRATAGALARRGRPNMTIHVDRVDARHLGGLFMLLEIATIYAGELYGVNPLDQPGVELGKQFTYAMLGRADAEQARQEWNLLPKPDARFEWNRLSS